MVLFCVIGAILAPYSPFHTIKTPSARLSDPVDGVFCFLMLGYTLTYRGIYRLSWPLWVIVAFMVIKLQLLAFLTNADEFVKTTHWGLMADFDDEASHDNSDKRGLNPFQG